MRRKLPPDVREAKVADGSIPINIKALKRFNPCFREFQELLDRLLQERHAEDDK